MPDRKIYPPSWSWDRDGNEVSGEVIEIRHMPEKVKNGRTFRETDIMEVEGPQGLVSVWLSPAGLRRWLQLDSPQMGDYVTIRFEGWEPILDRETNKPKPHPDDPSKVWEMRTFSATVDMRASTGEVSPGYAPPVQPPGTEVKYPTGGPGGGGGYSNDEDIPFAPSYI